jgi:hypothetical protein
VKIITICSADRERCRLNRFYRFCGLDLGKGLAFFGGGGWERVDFFTGGDGMGSIFGGGGVGGEESIFLSGGR